MPYHFKAGETIPDNIRRIVGEEVETAVKMLSGTAPGNKGEEIHEARKSIKKLRGVLRLIRADLGPAYRSENVRLRDTGRRLSEVRDAFAVIEVFDALTDRFKEQIRPESLRSIKKGLEDRQRGIESTANNSGLKRRAIAALHSVGRSAKTWSLKSDGFVTIAPGLKEIYKSGRTALALVQSDPTSENYHEFRKRVKDHWYHVRLLENIWAGPMEARESNLKDLQDWLGDDHNLVVLREIIEGDPKQYGKGDESKLLLTLVAQVQEELRRNSVSLGERLFEEKPRQFTKSMARLWSAWQRQPKSFKHAQEEQPTLPRKSAPVKSTKKTKVA
jgi:CHAD domain-containing protein